MACNSKDFYLDSIAGRLKDIYDRLETQQFDEKNLTMTQLMLVIHYVENVKKLG